MKVGFIGTGIMGASMARNLLKAGHEVFVYNRTREKAERLAHDGAAVCGSVAGCASGRDVVITIVGFPEDVREVYFGEGGILSSASPGTVLVDMTTTLPSLACEIAQKAKERGLSALDAPVTGGDTGAREGTLSIMVGGDKDAFARCLPLFEAMGKNIRFMGDSGCGQQTKACNQIMIAGALTGVCEAFAYARRQGLSPEAVMEAVAGGSADSAQLRAFGPRLCAGDLAPGFFMKHFIKDMRIAQREASEKGLELPMLSTVLSMYEELAADGLSELGTQALIRHYEA